MTHPALDIFRVEHLSGLMLADMILLAILVIILPLASVLERSSEPIVHPSTPSARKTRTKKTVVNIIILWTIAVLALGAWIIRGEDPLDFGLTLPTDWTTMTIIGWGIGGGLALIYILGNLRQTQGDAAKVMDLLEKEPGIAAISPAEHKDYPLWAGLSISAGITEEIVYRGYLIALLTPLVGLYAAATLS